MLSRLRYLIFSISYFSKLVHSIPVGENQLHGFSGDEKAGMSVLPALPNVSEYMGRLLVSVFLILLGGVFAGLTIALMGVDDLHLEVLARSGDEKEQLYSKKVLGLLRRGKHWVLVTLLLGNVIVNETLPIVFDSIIGGGWPAVILSTAMIVIFGEVIPQAVCVRYGLMIGAKLEPLVLFMMYLLYPIAYPMALVLDACLGKAEGTMYKKSGLKTLVTLHRDLGLDKLNQDEVTIINAVLDLREKPARTIMTPIENVFTLSADRILDEALIEEIVFAGYSRIPIHKPGFPTDFIGMLLIKTLLGYDPEDRLPVYSFPLATLPETWPETSCLDLLNYCQEGKSHMILVSTSPGENHGAIGVITLEDIVEELIGEEIIDETDVYIDVRQKLRRVNNTNAFWQRLFHRAHMKHLDALRKSPRPDIQGKGTPNEYVPILNPKNAAINPKIHSTERIKVKPASNALALGRSYGSIDTHRRAASEAADGKVKSVNAELQRNTSSSPDLQKSALLDSTTTATSTTAEPSSTVSAPAVTVSKESEQPSKDQATTSPANTVNASSPHSSPTVEAGSSEQLKEQSAVYHAKPHGSVSSSYSGRRVRLGNVIESRHVTEDGVERVVVAPTDSVHGCGDDVVEMKEVNGILVPKVSTSTTPSNIPSRPISRAGSDAFSLGTSLGTGETSKSLSNLSAKSFASRVKRNRRRRHRRRTRR
ncbi:morphology protein [Schizosaccharomyces japonicus yFS275]|uniref:Morphology protein n=1 Tax=Schizosaccharomyces japonicus (strain yFS275 / FY16936) TaxID=402676 RepID=B6K5Y5_SCHJY|nr:morphology protein [Schizosaccharomyces japonicus yFS275]EEB08939.2 morphology protein [Schizosaccharomyces japonicus yFS275]